MVRRRYMKLKIINVYNRIKKWVENVKENIIIVILITIVLPLIVNIVKPIFIDAEDYAKMYNSYVYQFVYDENKELNEQIEEIKSYLNIEDRIEKVMISPYKINEIILVVFSDSNIHNLGYYTFNMDVLEKFEMKIDKYIKNSTKYDTDVLYEKITPDEVFMLVAPSAAEGIPMNYLRWESPTYEIASSVISYNGKGYISRSINGLEYIVYDNNKYGLKSGTNSIDYKKTVRSIWYHIMNNFSL